MTTDQDVADQVVPSAPPDRGEKIVYWLALLLVIVGMFNSMPGIPGIDQAMQSLSGAKDFVIRGYPYEYFYPLVFATMMFVVALKHSQWRKAKQTGAGNLGWGLFLDTALVVSALAISLTYVVEIEAVCAIDRITGERAALIAESLKTEREFAELYGLPVPDSVEDPQCINTTGGWLVAIMGLSVIVFLAYNVRVWGLPLVLVSIAVAAYTIITV